MASTTRYKGTLQRSWAKMTRAEVKAFSAESKQAIKEKVDNIIERYMKPKALNRRGRRAAFGDIQDIYTKWHGHSLILMRNVVAVAWQIAMRKISRQNQGD